MTRLIALGELRRFYVTPGFWVLGSLMQAGLAWLFFVHLDRFIDLQPRMADTPGAPGVTDLVAAPTLLDAAALLLLAAPLLAMRTLSEERKTGSLLLLQAAPVTDWQIVAGKFLGLVAVLVVPAMIAVAMVMSLYVGTGLDGGRLVTASLGLGLSITLASAAGVWVSGMSRHPPLAAGLLYGLFLFLWLSEMAVQPAHPSENLVQWLALTTHLGPLMEGRLRLADLGYFAAVTGAFLVLARTTLGRLRGGYRRLRTLARDLPIVVLAIAGVWLSMGLEGEWDLSAGGRHGLSATSRGTLERLEGAVKLTAFVGDDAAVRRAIRSFTDRYRRHYPALTLEFVDPRVATEEARELAIPASGAVRVEYRGGSELLLKLSETELTGALLRLLLRGENWVVGITGHGERRFDGDANHDLRDFGAALKREGFRLHTVDLPGAAAIPENTGVLVVADPRVDFRLGEKALVADYLAQGGNLLWLADPDPDNASAWLEGQIPVNRLPGAVIDAQGARLGLDDPRNVAVGSYASHPLTAHLQSLTLFPQVAALGLRAAVDEWQSTVLLSSSAASWNETGEIRGEVSRDRQAGETLGPLALAIALERDGQRILVVGDSDFLSNAYLGNGGNLDLGLAMIRWLTANDALIDIPAPFAVDARIELPRQSVAVLAALFLIGIPLAMTTGGLLVHFRRKRR